MEPRGNRDRAQHRELQDDRSAPYLLVAHLVARASTRPAPIVSSQPGSWAPNPINYHGPIGGINHVVLHGARAGAATVDYHNTQGILAGTDSVTYRGYSDNGGRFRQRHVHDRESEHHQGTGQGR